MLVRAHESIAESAKARNYSRMHSKALSVLAGPLSFLEDWANVTISNIDRANIFKYKNDTRALPELFNLIQEDLIRSDLNNCSKTAWFLPNYLAQIFHRMLKKSKKYSDVSSGSYSLSEVTFYYDHSYVPSSILQQISFLQTTGLFEWWPKLINRSDLVTGKDTNILREPNMSGNILVIFVILGCGIVVAVACFAVERSITILRCFTQACIICGGILKWSEFCKKSSISSVDINIMPKNIVP